MDGVSSYQQPSNNRNMISWIFFIVAAIMLIFGVGTGISTFSWLKGAQTAQGTVVELVEKRSSSKKKGSNTTYAPKIRYNIDGHEREFVSSQSSSSPNFASSAEFV